MKVILLDNVAKVGRKYEVKEVSDGYALNFMIPKGLAQLADDKTLKRLENEKKAHEEKIKAKEEAIVKEIGNFEKTALSIKAKANAKGHLFAGIHKEEIISEAKNQLGVEFEPEFIELDSPIKEAGEHEIDIKVGDKGAKLKLNIEAE